MAGGPPSGQEQVRTAEAVAALSLATDLGIGLPFEHGLHATLCAMRLCERLQVDTDTASQAYYGCLLFYIGCTADAETQAELYEGALPDELFFREVSLVVTSGGRITDHVMYCIGPGTKPPSPGAKSTPPICGSDHAEGSPRSSPACRAVPTNRERPRDRLFDGLATAAKALGNGRRAEIVDVLAQGERHVEEVAAEIGQSVANTSQYLQLQLRGGLAREPASVSGPLNVLSAAPASTTQGR